MSRVLIVEDDPRIAAPLQGVIEQAGFGAEHQPDAERALERLRETPFEVVITDVRLPGVDGIELLRRCKAARPTCEVVVMTGHASVPLAREALLLGAADFLTKPFSPERDLVPLLRRLLATPREEEPPPAADVRGVPGEPVGESALLRRSVDRARRIAASEANVLLRGESGTGKEIFASLIHQHLRRAREAFIKVNCASLPADLLESELFGHCRGAFTGADRDRVGLFETAHRGSLLLDEVGEIPLALQPKLLRVIQEGEFHRVGDAELKRVDVRILAATNRNLEEAMHRGHFRSDLYYRLAVVPLTLPTLRDRPEDLPALVAHFAALFGTRGQVEVEPAAARRMREYAWPGNVRELANAVEHALVLGDGRTIRLADLPVSLVRSRQIPDETLGEIEKRTILQALERCGGNRTRAARLLGITRRTLGYRIQKYALVPKTLPARPGPARGASTA